MNGAKAVIEAMKREGVTHIFGLPGTTVMHFLDALYEEKEIRYITTRHEQVASFMADGFARGSGDVGVCMASRGPGAANMTIGMHNAYAESIPVVALLGQVSDEIYYRDSFEEMDLVSFYKPITKEAYEIHQTNRIPELVQRAVHTAKSGRPRPVLISVPLDVQRHPMEGNFPKPAPLAKSGPDPQSVKEAVKLLVEAKRPVVFAGGGVKQARAYDTLIQLAETLGLPVVSTYKRKDAFPNRHPHFLGTTGPGVPASTKELLKQADVILAIGNHFSEFSTYRWSLIPPEAKIIHADIDVQEIGKIYTPDVALLGDAKLTMEAILCCTSDDQVQRIAADSERRDYISEWRDRYLAETQLPATSETCPVPSSGIVRTLKEKFEGKDDYLFVIDASTFGGWMERYFYFEPNTFYRAAGGSMGWGFPASMGIQLARPDKRVINITGDGSFWMVAQDLETAVRENIPVVVIVTNNFSYGNTRERQTTSFGGRYIGNLYQNPDFAQFARLLGAHGERVERLDELGPAIERSLNSGLPAVIDVIQDAWEGLPPEMIPIIAR